MIRPPYDIILRHSIMTQRASDVPREVYLLIAFLIVFWGLNWPIMKIGASEINVFSFRALNVLVSAFGFLLIARLRKRKVAPDRHDWRGILPVALIGVAGWNALILYGLTLMDSGRAAILGYTMPLWATAISFLVLSVKITTRQAFGLILGVSAMGLLLFQDLEILQQAPVGTMICVAAAFCWGLTTVYLRHFGFTLATSSLSFWMNLLAVPPLAVLAIMFDDTDWGSVSWPAWGALVYNMTIAGCFCFYAFNRIAMIVPVVVSSVSTLLVPVAGVFFGAVMLAEQPGFYEFGALGLVVLAVGSVILPSSKRE